MSQALNNEIIIYYLAGTGFVLIFITAIVIYVFQHLKKVNAFRQKLHDEELIKQDAIFSALQEGEEKERARLAEELHDGVGAKLSGLNMNLEYVRPKITDPDTKNLINKTFEGVSEVINEIRELSHNLQPLYFSEKDLLLSLQDYISQLNSKGDCHYILFFEADLSTVNKAVKLHCYRIITELLLNVHKHATATQAFVQIIEEKNTLQIIVEDNGQGFRENGVQKGMGLSNINSRVSLNKGTINIDSSGKGTTIIIQIPI
jgi:signal transduction histidine kinase